MLVTSENALHNNDRWRYLKKRSRAVSVSEIPVNQLTSFAESGSDHILAMYVRFQP